MSRSHRARQKERRRTRDGKIAVLTPSVPGREAMLAECLESVAAQTLKPDFHVVMVDHGLEGPGPLLNRMFRSVDAEWYMPFGDDDLMNPNHLELHRAEDADLVYSTPDHVGREGEEYYDGPLDLDRLVNRQDAGIRGSFLFRRTVFTTVGGFSDNVICDWEFLVDAARSGVEFAKVPQPTDVPLPRRQRLRRDPPHPERGRPRRHDVSG